MNRRTPVILGATGLLALVAALPTGAVASAKAKPEPTPTPVEYTETGCYDLSFGGASYQKLLASIQTLTPPSAGAPGTYADLKLSKEGVLETSLGLSAPSCSDATYEIEAYDSAGNSLGKATATGNGTDSIPLDLVVRDQAGLSVFVQARTVAPTGQVVDRGVEGTGADGSVELVADADGTPRDGGGGTVAWR